MIETNTSATASRANQIQERAAEAEKIASLSRVMRGSRSFNIDLGGSKYRRDTVSIASGSRLYAEADSQKALQSSAREAVSLLQTAEAGMAEAADKLERMEALAAEVIDAGNTLSSQDRQAYQNEFEALRGEIDEIAADTEFGGTALLQGGDTPGSPLSFDVTVSTHPEGKALSISIDAASVSDLSAGLETASLLTAAGAAAAASNIDDAVDALGSARARVRADSQSLSTAVQQAEIKRTEATELGNQHTEIKVDVDFARLVGEQIIKEADVALPNTDAELMRIGLRNANSEKPQTSLAATTIPEAAPASAAPDAGNHSSPDPED